MSQASWSETIWGWYCGYDNTTTFSFIKKYESDLGLDQYEIDNLKAGQNYPDPEGQNPDGVWPVPYLIQDVAKNKFGIELDILESSNGEHFVGICPYVSYPWSKPYVWPAAMANKSEDDLKNILLQLVKDILPNADEPTYHECEYWS